MRKSVKSDPRDELIQILLVGVRDLLDSQTKLIKEVLTHRAIEEDVLRQNRFASPAVFGPGKIPSILDSRVPMDGPMPDWAPEATGFTLGGPPFIPPTPKADKEG